MSHFHHTDEPEFCRPASPFDIGRKSLVGHFHARRLKNKFYALTDSFKTFTTSSPFSMRRNEKFHALVSSMK
jgi:hypothetical protein